MFCLLVRYYGEVRIIHTNLFNVDIILLLYRSEAVHNYESPQDCLFDIHYSSCIVRCTVVACTHNIVTYVIIGNGGYVNIIHARYGKDRQNLSSSSSK